MVEVDSRTKPPRSTAGSATGNSVWGKCPSTSAMSYGRLVTETTLKLDRRTHDVIRSLPARVPEGALLVVNDTRVLPTRFRAGRVEVTLVEGPAAADGTVPLRFTVEEIIRYDNPLHYFRRTALVDTELSGTRIAAGDKVAMYYTSANRDERVFADPQTFDIRRKPNPHLSFGMGGHFCLGAHLARLEGRVFFAALLDAFGTIDLTGEPVRVRSNLNNSLKTLPIRLAA